MPEVITIDPRQCEAEPCTNAAHHTFEGWALCRECMYTMATMNGDNEEIFAPVLSEVVAEAAK
jgi:hypothetical protein